MTSGQPLLSSYYTANSPKSVEPSGSIFSSSCCLCIGAHCPSDCNKEPVNSGKEWEDIIGEVGNCSGGQPEKAEFDSKGKNQFVGDQVLGCPHQNGLKLISFSPMELQGLSSSLEVPVSSTRHESSEKPQRVRQKSVCFEDAFSSEDNPRLIYINDPRKTNDKYEFTGNEIRTSKYTVITFLPKNLFIQFHRLAYVYFLVIAGLNQLPPLAVFGRTVSLFPLLFVLSVTAIKDGYEDWRRHRSDRNENNREALVFQCGHFVKKKWKNICAGEVVKVLSDETIPCDMVLLGTSDANGIAYIQTMNLDGESNLKTRYARQETASVIQDIGSFLGLIRCEQPNRNIYEFTANMEFNGQKVPLGQSNIVLRGCQLKNIEWIVGVVVYAGQETKAMLNSTVSPSKRSRLESHMNRETLWLSAFLLVICSTVALGMAIWLLNHKEQLDILPYYRRSYFRPDKDDGKRYYKYYGIPMETLVSFLSSVIVFQIMIPISLYITMELVRLGQSYFMIEDRYMFDSNANIRFQCRSLNINEDLGQIRYIFSDKTGTLTENKMEFRRACVYGKDYGGSLQENINTIQESDRVGELDTQNHMLKSKLAVDRELISLLQNGKQGDERTTAHEFFLTLAVCNTIIPVPARNSPCSSATELLGVEAIDYQGESPDEQALVIAACNYGYTLIERTSGHVVVDVNGKKMRLNVLGLHEFDSVRKRMSVVIRFPNNAIKVLVKGADSSMLSILDMKHGGQDPLAASLKLKTESHLNGYSSEGLRTLVIGVRNLNNDEFEEWKSKYDEASTALVDRSMKLRQAASLVECKLSLLGATAIEDKLQEGVPEAIESLRQAGIKVWVLTGDKQETAISIGLSCKLLTCNMCQIIINGSSEDECRQLLVAAKAKYGTKSAEHGDAKLLPHKKPNYDFLEKNADTKCSNIAMPEDAAQDHRNFGSANSMAEFGDKTTVSGDLLLALIIDGSSLVHILEKDLERELFDLATSCHVVLCCRVAPLQKAGIVDMVKSRTNDMTLAIGDGANDVSMIQMADVGVGISGQEGRQAVMASDFAMGQFRFLKRLLLVHGHWNYQRVGYLVLYNFYRNAVFVLMLFWYILCTAFSTTSALTDWSSVFYSLIYTSVPTIVVGVLDKDLSHKTLLHYPKLYEAGHRQESYNLRLFWITMLDTLWQSLVIFLVPVFTYQNSTIDIWSMGSLWTISIVVLVNVHLAMDIRRWVFVTHVATWGSIVITYLCMVAIDSIPVFPNYWTIFHLASSRIYWLNILFITIFALLPRFLCKVIQETFWPSDIQIAREAEILKKFV